MTEASGENGEQLSLTQQIEAGIVALEALSGAETYEHGALMTGYNNLATLVDRALDAGDFDQGRAAQIKLEATNVAREIAVSNGDEDTATTLGQLSNAHEAVIDLIETVQSQQPADTSSSRTGSAKTRI